MRKNRFWSQIDEKKASKMKNSSRDLNAWSYLVVSSEQQIETLEFQRRWANDTAQQHGWSISETFEGVSSGRDGTRQLLQRLVERLAALPVDSRPRRVLMIRLDRLGRGLGLEALAALAQLVQLGVTVHTRQDGDYNILKASDSILPLMRIVTGGIENEARRDKARATYARRKADGHVLSNKRPYGIRLENGQDVPQEPQAATVRLAFELSANGYGLIAIGNKLRAIAAPKIYANGRIHVTEWTADRVQKMLTNRAYCNTVVGEVIWHRVQKLRDGRPKTYDHAKNPWPLSGALRCECGRNLIGSLRGSPGARVYRCSAASVHGKTLTYSAARLEQQFVELLQSLATSRSLLRQYVKASDSEAQFKLEEAVEKRREIQAILKDVADEGARVWQLNKRGLLLDVHLARRLSELDQQKAVAQEDLDEIQMHIRHSEVATASFESAMSIVEEASELWKHAPTNRQQVASRSLSRALNGLTVRKDGRIYVGPPTEWHRFFKPQDQREA